MSPYVIIVAGYWRVPLTNQIGYENKEPPTVTNLGPSPDGIEYI